MIRQTPLRDFSAQRQHRQIRFGAELGDGCTAEVNLGPLHDNRLEEDVMMERENAAVAEGAAEEERLMYLAFVQQAVAQALLLAVRTRAPSRAPAAGPLRR
ncbi:hypothetical protein EJB05_40517 [Eragrostis curvula]|uniref:Uncharacterized protein n=1 Tax=Eragrostis curvula TaxID=38414 RepID=A0A5J9TPZ7_9POAL|nr:hypothetical protein EJB05_40517 [Eragrostis curvula]